VGKFLNPFVLRTESSKGVIVHLALIALVSAILTISWFWRGGVIAYAEPGLFMYNDGQTVHNLSSAWVDQISVGTPGLTIAKAALPLFALLALLEGVGFSPLQAEATFFYLILASCGLSMYYLCNVAFDGDPRRHSIAMFASMFYILNPYALVYIWNRFTITMNTTYVMIPLVLALYMKGLNVKKYAYAVYAAMVLLLFSAWLGLVPVLVPFLLLTYLAYHLISHRKKDEILHAAKFSGVLLVVGIAVNLWILILLVFNLRAEWWGFSTPNFAKSLISGYPLQDVMSLNFYFGSNSVIWPFYESAVGKVLGALIPIVVFSALITRKKVRSLPYFGFLAVLGLFLAFVATTPLRDEVAFALDRVPLSAVITNNMFGEKALELSAMGYSALFGIALSSVRLRTIHLHGPPRIQARYLLAACLLGSIMFSTCVAYVWPMWTGGVFTYPDTPTQEKLTNVVVPGYYTDAATWLSTQKDEFRILSLPFIEGGITYSWAPYGYSGSTTDFVLLPKPVIMESQGGMSNDLIRSIPELMHTGRTNDVWKVLSSLSVRYIMLHGDINPNVRYLAEDPKDLGQQLNLTLVPHLNVQEMRNQEGGPITSSLEGWQSIWGNPPAQVSLVNKTDGLSYVKYSANTLPNNGYFMLAYVSKNPVDLSGAKWIDLTLMSSLPGNMYVVVEDVKGNQMIFDGRSSPFYAVGPDEINRWVNETIPLTFPSYTTSNKPDLTQIRDIQIGFVDLPKDIPSTLKIGGVVLDKGVEAPIEGIHFERQFGELRFYKVDNNLERAYASVNPFIVNNTSEAVDSILSRTDGAGQSVFITGPAKTLLGNNLPASAPKIELEKLSPVKWTIHVVDATGPFFLVFNDAYNPQWKAYYESINWVSGFLDSPIPDQFHFVANAYANSWYVDRTGTYTITLYFWPQNFVVAGALVSGVAVVFSLVAVFRTRIESSVLRIISSRKIQKATSLLIRSKNGPRET
jgi:hypothetical protein